MYYEHPLSYYSRPSRAGDVPPGRSGSAGQPIPSIAEQMGVDPVSKLAAAIEKLASALETWGGTRSEGMGG